MEQDISESHNQLAANREIAAKLTEQMQTAIDRGRRTPGGLQVNEFELSLQAGDRKPKKSLPKKARQ